MRYLGRGLAVLVCIAVVGCTAAPEPEAASGDPAVAPVDMPGENRELTRHVAVFEAAVAEHDETTADAAFMRVAAVLMDDCSATTADGRTGQDVLFEIGDVAWRMSGVPPGSCEVCTAEAFLGHMQTDAMALFLCLYPDDERSAEAVDVLAPGPAEKQERAQRYVEEIETKLIDAGVSTD